MNFVYEIPFELSARINFFDNLFTDLKTPTVWNRSGIPYPPRKDRLENIIRCNKITHHCKVPVFIFNNRTYQCLTFNTLDINNHIQREYDKNNKIFCIYYISTDYIRGCFIDIPDDYVIKDIVDRNEIIDKLIN